jgi:hypothetical protein
VIRATAQGERAGVEVNVGADKSELRVLLLRYARSMPGSVIVVTLDGGGGG